MKRRTLDSETTEHDNARFRADSTETQAQIENCPFGISFFSLMNKRRRYFLPSVKNFFGGIQIPKLLCDSGCSSSLLPVDSLDTLSKIFSWTDTEYRISSGTSPGGITISLIVTKNTPYTKFAVELCTDIINSPALRIDHIRFALCTEDIAWILENDSAASKFAAKELEKLRAEIKIHTRRSHGLIGQQILDQFASIKYKECQYTLPANFVELGHQLIDLVSQTKNDLPSSFDDWEDDDFAFEDDDHIVDFCEENWEMMDVLILSRRWLPISRRRMFNKCQAIVQLVYVPMQ